MDVREAIGHDHQRQSAPSNPDLLVINQIESQPHLTRAIPIIVVKDAIAHLVRDCRPHVRDELAEFDLRDRAAAVGIQELEVAAHLGDVCINDTLELLFQTLPHFLLQHDPNIAVTDSTIRIGLEVVEELIHLMQEVIINEIFR